MIRYEDDFESIEKSLHSFKESLQSFEKALVVIDDSEDEDPFKPLFESLIDNFYGWIAGIKLLIECYNSKLLGLQLIETDLLRLSEENEWLSEEVLLVTFEVKVLGDFLGTKLNDVESEENVLFMTDVLSGEPSLAKADERLNLNMLEVENEITHENFSLISEKASSNIKNVLFIIQFYINNWKSKRAITICKKTIESLKDDDSNNEDIALLYCILAFIYKNLKKWNDATEAMLEALRIREKIHGAESVIAASTISSLSIISAYNYKYREAESYCRRSLNILQNINPTDDILTAKQLNNLGFLLMYTESYDESYKSLRDALEIYEQNDDTEFHKIKSETNIAQIYVENEQIEFAETQTLKNLKGIYKLRFKKEYEEEIIDLYKHTDDKNLTNHHRTFVDDRFLMAEIVNLNYLIEIYSDINEDTGMALLQYLQTQNESVKFDLQNAFEPIKSSEETSDNILKGPFNDSSVDILKGLSDESSDHNSDDSSDESFDESFPFILKYLNVETISNDILAIDWHPTIN